MLTKAKRIQELKKIDPDLTDIEIKEILDFMDKCEDSI
jgi:hypothetical protein